MKITFLGQAGLFIRLDSGLTLAVDPYLSDSLRENAGERFARRFAPPIWEEVPQLVLISHAHGDHLDFGTLTPWLEGKKRLRFFGPPDVCKALEPWRKGHERTILRPETEFTMGNVWVCGVAASHEGSDDIGFLLKAEGKTLYITGDTLFTRAIPRQLEGEQIDLMLPCINGVGNNMGPEDAARLTDILQPKLVCPVHWDLFEAFGEDPQRFREAVHGPSQVQICQVLESILI